jgi:alpha,alpha-trehalose phosphorylase
MDLDLEHNTRDGVHIASLAGTWIALVSGFGGMRHHNGDISFAPRLPDGLARLAFRLLIHGRRLHVEVTQSTATYSLSDGETLEIMHDGQKLSLSAGKPQSQPVRKIRARPRPSQPPGREPARRRPIDDSNGTGRSSGTGNPG